MPRRRKGTPELEVPVDRVGEPTGTRAPGSALLGRAPPLAGVPQAVTIAVHLEDVGATGQAVEQGDCQASGLEDLPQGEKDRLLLTIALPCSWRALKA